MTLALKTLAAVSLLLPTLGCAMRPESAPWRHDQGTIGPTAPPPQGSLVVETDVAGSPEDGEIPRERFFVYDQTGRYFSYYPNNHFFPIGLPVGRYVVVSRYSGENKRVQVEIQEGLTTHVTLVHFKNAPVIE
jgi:hypothetical protein